MPQFHKLLFCCLLVTTGCINSQDTAKKLPQLQIQGTSFVDPHGKPVILRSINVGGGAKLPTIPQALSHEANFLDQTQISFVGSPLPLNTADEHFARIKNWGFNSVRLLTTWEAIAHAGPNTIDQAYIEYFTALVDKAGQAGLYVIVDMHQDVWSRFTGGDGAPVWTLAEVGFDVESLHELGATIVHSQAEQYPHLLWPTNHLKLAASTMFTLLLAGDQYSVRMVGDQTAQEFLVDQYAHSWEALAQALADRPHVLGYDIMNEPGTGFLGLASLDAWNSQLQMGPMPTPAQAMFAGSLSQDVPIYEFGGLGFETTSTTTLNPANKSVWTNGDIWAEAGVWVIENQKPIVKIPTYFASTNTDVIASITGFYDKIATRIHAIDDDAWIFMEPPAEHAAPIKYRPKTVYAPHWYDAYALISKEFDPEFNVRTEPEIELVIGRESVQALFNEQLARLKSYGDQSSMPTWIGEFGLPFDPLEPEFSTRIEALQMYYRAMEENQLSSALWNYNPNNTAQHGDGWNREDLSVISREHPNGRAVEGFAQSSPDPSSK